MQFRQGDALLIVDVQRDFCPGGALAIAGGDEIIPVINRLIEEASAAGTAIVASRDWHPDDHASFHVRGGLWPKHCVAGSQGAQFHKDLRLPADSLVLSKGMAPERDQYSAFDGTGLTDWLRNRGTLRVFICGLALDVCVRASALDAAQAGFETHVLLVATRPMSEISAKQAIEDMVRAGVSVE